MSKKPDKVASQLLERFREFCRRQMWKRFPDTHGVALELPGHAHRALGIVMGAAETSYGLQLFMGPAACATAAAAFLRVASISRTSALVVSRC